VPPLSQTAVPWVNAFPVPKIRYDTTRPNSYTVLGEPQINICPSAAGEGGVPVYSPTGRIIDGMELFYYTVLYEQGHFVRFSYFWGNDYNSYIIRAPLEDEDLDYLPTSFEEYTWANQSTVINFPYDNTPALIWYDSQQTATYPTPPSVEQNWMDEEDISCRESASFSGDRNLDWANPGLNHLTPLWDD
jgi:hypothetical protein